LGGKVDGVLAVYLGATALEEEEEREEEVEEEDEDVEVEFPCRKETWGIAESSAGHTEPSA
jgi:hypothetical protein